MNDMVLSEVANWSALVVGVITVITAVGGAMRYLNFKQSEKIIQQIKDATYPISPDANGGLSLPDVARRTEQIEMDVAEIRGQIDLLVEIYKRDGR